MPMPMPASPGQVVVVTAQNGPAATLLVPGLAEALKARSRSWAIVRDVHRQFTDRNAFRNWTTPRCSAAWRNGHVRPMSRTRITSSGLRRRDHARPGRGRGAAGAAGRAWTRP